MGGEVFNGMGDHEKFSEDASILDFARERLGVEEADLSHLESLLQDPRRRKNFVVQCQIISGVMGMAEKDHGEYPVEMVEAYRDLIKYSIRDELKLREIASKYMT